MTVNAFTTVLGLIKRGSYAVWELLAFTLFVIQLHTRDAFFTVSGWRDRQLGA